MNIDKKWLEEKGACSDGKEWFLKQGIEDPIIGLKNLIKHDKLDWANWLIIRVMTRPQYLAYAIFAAEQVIHIYEKKYPNGDKPRKAIEAAKSILANDHVETRADAAAFAAGYAAASAANDAVAAATYTAAYAAYAASAAAYAATATTAYTYAAAAATDAAACAATDAGYAAAYAAADAAAAYAATDAGYAAAYAAADAAAAYAAVAYAGKEMRIRILEYGIPLLEKVAQEWAGARK